MNATSVWRRGLRLTAALAVLATAGAATAQNDPPQRSRAEWYEDDRDERGERAGRLDRWQDRRDVSRFTVLVLKLELARCWEDRGLERRALAQIRTFLLRDRRYGDRDMRDEYRDAERDRQRLREQVRILRELRAIQPAVRRGDRRALRREEQLLREFTRLVRQRASENGFEWEDRSDQEWDGRYDRSRDRDDRDRDDRDRDRD